MKAPGVRVLYKTKAMPFTTIPKLKTGEVFTQAGHVLQRVLKHVGRATTVLIKQFTQHFITLEINDEKHMINGWLKPAHHYYQRHAIPMAAFEMDLERMYPSIPRHRVKPAWKALLRRFKQFLLIHRNDDQCYVYCGKGRGPAVGLPGPPVKQVL